MSLCVIAGQSLAQDFILLQRSSMVYWKFHTLYVLIVNLPFMSSIHSLTLPLLSLAVAETPVSVGGYAQFMFYSRFRQYFEIPSVVLIPVLRLCYSSCARSLFMDDSTLLCVTSPGSSYQFKHAMTFSYCGIEGESRIQNCHFPGMEYPCVHTWNIHINRYTCVSAV